MKPRNDRREQHEASELPKEPLKRRFQLVKLEERIAPSSGGHGRSHPRCLTDRHQTDCCLT
jgi:hypothetical protein